MTRTLSPSNESMTEEPSSARTAPPAQLSVPTTTTRPRSRTIAAALEQDFALSPASSISWGEGPGLTRPRGSTISHTGRPRSSSTADQRFSTLEPSVQIETTTRPRSNSRRSRASSHGEQTAYYPPPALTEEEHHSALETDILDVLDPEVSTASALSNVAASIAVPSLPHINFFRKPVVNIDDSPTGSTDQLVTGPVQPATTEEVDAQEQETFEAHVARLVRKKEEGIQWKKIGKGVWAFIKTPIGIFFLVYGILVVFWGAALVLILATAIPMPSQNTRDYWVEISSQILNGLFTITGIGLIPWRTVDTCALCVALLC